jgi:ABC-2 type transport system ATP-binding protein
MGSLSDAAITLRGVSKRFKETLAVDALDLDVPRGQIIGMLGPNGAGKTTTILLLLGVTTPDAGEITVLGERYPHGRTRAIERSNFFASYLGFPSKLKVRQMFEVFGDLYGSPPGAVDEAIERFDISHLMSKLPSEMSTGQKTLVGMARATLNRPELLILDEPTASLDPEIAERLRAILRRLHADHGMTILITSHNMADIERLCSRVVFIGHGRVIADDAPRALAARYGVDDLESTFLQIAGEVRR